MKKKIKIDSLYLVVLGDIINPYSYNKKYIVRETAVVLAHSKYSFFNKGRIKYFKNILDNTKYYTKDLYQSTNCLFALRYTPLSVLLSSEELKKGYINEDEIEKYIKSNFARKFIEETIDIFNEINTEKKLQDTTRYQGSKLSKENYIKKNYYTTLTEKPFINEPIIGREQEIKNLILTLAQAKNNPLLIGDPGVGKTALIDELAYMIQNGNVPNILKGRIK